MPIIEVQAFSAANESSFFTLFEQDRVPSAQEQSAIEVILTEKTANFDHLLSQIPERQCGKIVKIPHGLLRELQYLGELIAFHRALLAPWRRLPVEIISQIFQLTLESRVCGDAFGKDDRAGTLRLCNVCPIWRAIALQTPALWNILSIRSPIRPMKWVSTWLERSRSLPVALELRWGDGVYPQFVLPVLSTFAMHLNHTVELSLGRFANKPYQKLMDDLYSIVTFKPRIESIQAPLLSTVRVNLPAKGSVWRWIHAACHTSRCVSRFSTSHLALDRFPMTNVTVLELLNPLPMLEVFRIFEEASSIEKIAFYTYGTGAVCSPQSRLGMKSVKSLRIGCHEEFGEFLQCAEFPNLVDFAIREVDDWPSGEMDAFLSRCSCALRSLEIFDCTLLEIEVIECLRHKACNTLESLTVMDPCVPVQDAFLKYLTYQGPDYQLPCLAHIHLQTIYASDGLLSALVESRSLQLVAQPSSDQLTPVQLNQIQFSFFMYPSFSHKQTHPIDWKRLRELESMTNGRLVIVWPAAESDSEDEEEEESDTDEDEDEEDTEDEVVFYWD
ncbi:hypothetical protein R3P38DRAFT_2516528 [Favolaschia claudopus]|uniref:F-box domain-containing protein n=1 Tax=Favolaschia claudopus TaxID=2862362 RepID=A0AAW0CFX5_9AGAR